MTPLFALAIFNAAGHARPPSVELAFRPAAFVGRSRAFGISGARANSESLRGKRSGPDRKIKGPFVEKHMRYAMLATLMLTVGISAPVSAEKTQTSSMPGWNDCYDLAWIRGVHAEQGELPDFMVQCTAGKIPFGEDFLRYYKRQRS